MQHIIQQLAEIGQLKNICHEQGNSVPMPSVETLSVEESGVALVELLKKNHIL